MNDIKAIIRLLSLRKTKKKKKEKLKYCGEK